MVELIFYGMVLFALALIALGASLYTWDIVVVVDWTMPTRADRKTRKMLDS